MVVDTMIQMAQMGGGSIPLYVVGGAGLSALIGKALWQTYGSNEKTCKYHDQMHTDIIETKTNVEWIKNYLTKGE